jgi:DNA-binding NtrC family response regulator
MAKQRCTKARILFVDDEASIRLTLPRVLAKLGFDITSVGSLDDALAEIKTEKFDILPQSATTERRIHRNQSNAKSAASLHQFHFDRLSRR